MVFAASVAATAQVAEQPAGEPRDCETTIRLLSEELAIARTEAELLRQRWLAAEPLQRRSQDAGATAGSIQLAECLRSWQQVEAERKECRQRLERLVAAAGRDERTWQVELAHAREWLAAEKLGALQLIEAAALAPVRVLDFNRGLRLVVLAAGERQGVRIGMPFLIRRGEQVLGRVRVVEVRRNVSGAVLEDWRNRLLPLAGDMAQVASS